MHRIATFWEQITVGSVATILLIGLLLAPLQSAGLLLSIASAIALLCLAMYVVVETATVLADPSSVQQARIALRIQAACTFAVGCFLFFTFPGAVRPLWVLAIALSQPILVAAAERVVHRRPLKNRGMAFYYASGSISLLSAIALLLGLYTGLCALTYASCAYLCIFGLHLLALMARPSFVQQTAAARDSSRASM